MQNIDFKQKYLKYKKKYLSLKMVQEGGSIQNFRYTIDAHGSYSYDKILRSRYHRSSNHPELKNVPEYVDLDPNITLHTLNLPGESMRCENVFKTLICNGEINNGRYKWKKRFPNIRLAINPDDSFLSGVKNCITNEIIYDITRDEGSNNWDNVYGIYLSDVLTYIKNNYNTIISQNRYPTRQKTIDIFLLFCLSVEPNTIPSLKQFMRESVNNGNVIYIGEPSNSRIRSGKMLHAISGRPISWLRPAAAPAAGAGAIAPAAGAIDITEFLKQLDYLEEELKRAGLYPGSSSSSAAGAAGVQQQVAQVSVAPPAPVRPPGAAAGVQQQVAPVPAAPQAPVRPPGAAGAAPVQASQLRPIPAYEPPRFPPPPFRYSSSQASTRMEEDDDDFI